ncbi:exported hypothetical protein [uncultured Mycobacterium sp.]|uniref:Uncharacterized protein n=1 Tax=uncultured Mycobacterium sp. TaxID=171292 RepID=A0A1Y5PM72_9MYCO|nr:exported hypothetical protein [uncultured Mycobacterium sp.]
MMTWSGILEKTAAGLGAVALPVVFAIAEAEQAAADPGIDWGSPGQVRNAWCPGDPPGHWKGGPHGIPCT